MNRMTHIDRSILRIGVFEMIYCSKDVPTRVVIDEALRLSHSFAEQGYSSSDKRDTNKVIPLLMDFRSDCKRT